MVCKCKLLNYVMQNARFLLTASIDVAFDLTVSSLFVTLGWRAVPEMSCRQDKCRTALRFRKSMLYVLLVARLCANSENLITDT